MAAHISGPVPIGAQEYISRDFETDLYRFAIRKEWVLLLGPRQHGKTSALLRLTAKLKQEAKYRVAFVDLQSQPPCDSYEQFLEWFSARVWRQVHGESKLPDSVLKKLWKKSKTSKHPDQPCQKNDLVEWLKVTIPADNMPVAIIIDEAASISNDEWRNSFYGQIRYISGERATADNSDISKRITFIFSGTFRVETLVDTANSPFNVCRELITENFSKTETEKLCKITLCTDENKLSKEIFDYVSGQPFLVQSLLSSVESVPETERNEELERNINIMDDGISHTHSIFIKVIEDPSLVSIVTDVVKNNKTPLRPADSNMKYLRILGILKKEGANLVFSNKCYANIAAKSPQLNPEKEVKVALRSIFYDEPESSFDFIKNAELKEIAYNAQRGAVLAFNGRRYRFALIGYGLAVEAILVYWLSNQDVKTLDAAVKAAKAQFRGREKKHKPDTWNLVNLIAVGRALRPGKMQIPVDISDTIREWRNCVHPAVMIKKYEPEEDLEPYALTAAGLFRTVLHQIG